MGRARPAALVMTFATARAPLRSILPRIVDDLAPDGAWWACWPKRSSGWATELTETTVRDLVLPSGLVDIKVCAVTNIWSGLKFVRRVKDRDRARPFDQVARRANRLGARTGAVRTPDAERPRRPAS
jgi:hypothetical protein